MHCFELSSGNSLDAGRLREQGICRNSKKSLFFDKITTSHSSVHISCFKMSTELPIYIFWCLRNRKPLVIVSCISC